MVAEVYIVSDTLTTPTKAEYIKLEFNKRSLIKRIEHIKFLYKLIKEKDEDQKFENLKIKPKELLLWLEKEGWGWAGRRPDLQERVTKSCFPYARGPDTVPPLPFGPVPAWRTGTGAQHTSRA